MTKPKLTGSIFPSSRFLVKRLVNYVPANSTVLEIGAGTGVITLELVKRGWSSDRLFICEYDQDFCYGLEEKFPRYPVFCEDASMAHKFLKPNSIDCVVSGLPLRNFSGAFKQDLVASLKQVVKPGGKLIQYTYGMTSPLPLLRGEKCECVFANLPPAFIWKYHFDI
jgi:phosphatidylethanolamine/phosphatidyl-N-methylethanolamine N-methyltransferase